MGEKRSLFSIPAYLKVGDKRFKVIKWGVDGAVVENSPVLKSQEPVKAEFIFPYDAYNELLIPDVKIRCFPENGTLFCRFESLSKDQEKIFKFLVREYLWRRIISIPSEFMNYTQDKEVRRELLALQRNISLKSKLRKFLYVMLLIVISGTVFLGLKTLITAKSPELTVKYSELTASRKEEKTDIPVENESSQSVKSEEEIGKNTSAPGTELTEKKTQAKEIEQPEVETVVKVPEKEQKTVQKESLNHQNSTSVSAEANLSRAKNYYCVQVATDVSAERLIKLAQNLKGFPYVRVEKIGRYYTLRVGFDESFRKDRKLADEIRKKVGKSVFPRICAYRPERWVYPQEEVR